MESAMNHTCENLVLIPGGEFQMGSDTDKDHSPVHKVRLNSFYIDQYEVTNILYHSFCKATGHRLPWFWRMDGFRCGPNFPNHPVVGVSWQDAAAYADWCGKRLPTEAEWEYAAREQGKKIKYANGREYANPREINFNVSSDSNSSGDSKINSSMLTQQSVGAYPPNVLGIFQMSGNVWEWCLDWYEYNYDPEKTINPTGPWLGKYKVIRGGSFYNSAQAVRTTERSFLAPHRYASDVGFRVARSLTKQTVD